MRVIAGLLSLGLVIGVAEPAWTREKNAEDEIILKAKHFRTTAPCIQVGDALEMPIVDAFEVLKVIQGSLPKSVKMIQVRALSGDVENVHQGKVNLLHFTPSADTKSQLQDQAQDAYVWLVVDADELEVREKAK